MLCYSLFLILLSYIGGAYNEDKLVNLTIGSQYDALTHLNQYGYNPCADSTGVRCSIRFSSLLKDFQKRFQLNITGILDDSTRQLMNRPRCANKDPPVSLSKKSVASLRHKWSRSMLTWSLRNYAPYIYPSESHRAMQQAFGLWSQHIPLKFTEVCPECSPNLLIDFGYAYHGDEFPFDGPGGKLAHAYSPEDGRIHFDMEEPWTISYDGHDINLYVVAVHEIGHALGLDHQYDKSSIMYPYYQLMKQKDTLPHFDQILIQHAYGSTRKPTTRATRTKTVPPRSTTKTTARTTIKTTARTTIKTTARTTVKTTTRTTVKTTIRTRTTTRSATTAPSINHLSCRQFIDAAFDFPDNTFHVLDTGMLKRYLPDRQRWDTRVIPFQHIYHRLPNRIAGGAYDFVTNEAFIFTSTRVYRYRIRLPSYQVEYRRDDLLPTHLQGVIVGAIFYQDEIYVIKAESLQSFDINYLQRKSTERKLSEEFPKFSGSVKTAFTSGYLHYFFTSDRLVYIWNEQFNRWKTYAKPMETNLFACRKNTPMRHHRK